MRQEPVEVFVRVFKVVLIDAVVSDVESACAHIMSLTKRCWLEVEVELQVVVIEGEHDIEEKQDEEEEKSRRRENMTK